MALPTRPPPAAAAMTAAEAAVEIFTVIALAAVLIVAIWRWTR